MQYSRGLVALVSVTLLATSQLVAAEDLDWWKTTVFYQIYPRSFKDNNGDGSGDLEGITSKLEHLKDIGVGGVWMSPIFTSPMADFGYDISDFRDIDPLFGSMDDFKKLLQKANELGIKVILDFVPNHSSDEHEWFKASRQNNGSYKDYYIWRPPREGSEDESPKPPNDWMGSFSESVWTYEPNINEFYYHRYNYKQPDLNYRNEAVREDMKNILRFWLDQGVHGFRVDSVTTLVEDESFPDVPNSENDKYCVNQPMNFEIVNGWREVMEEYTAKDKVTRVLMLEAYGRVEDLLGYYGNDTHPGAHFTFNFQFITDLNNDSSAQNYVNTINDWIDHLPQQSAPNWVIGNHDQHRVASRLGSDLAAGVAMLSLLLPGIGVIYNGEEIGMVNNWDITYEETLDPSGVNAGPDGYRTSSRDFERTPFQWDNTTDAGFSTADKTWLPVEANFMKLNLASEIDDPSSYYNIYKSLLEARKTDTFKSGSLTSVAVSDKVVAISRDLDGAESYLVVVNLGESKETVDLGKAFEKTLPVLKVYTANTAAQLAQDETIDAGSLPLPPKASVVFKSSANGIVVNIFAMIISSLIALGFSRSQ